MIEQLKNSARRKFLKTGAVAAAAAAGTVAMPNVSRAQTVTLKMQGSWGAQDIINDYAKDYVEKVNQLGGGRLKIDYYNAGAIVKPFSVMDGVHEGVLDAGHTVPAYWYGKHRAASLFGTGPAYGFNGSQFLGWFYYGGGDALYKDLVQNELKLNVEGFYVFAFQTQPLGWFKKEIKTADDFKGMKFRTVGLSADLFKELGCAVTILPGGEIVPAIDRGLIDGAEFNNPSSDILLGFPDVSKHFMMRSHHQQMESFEISFNKAKYNALPAELRAILRYAAFAATADQFAMAHDRYSKDMEEIKKRGVTIYKTPDAVLEAQLKAWDKVVEANKDPFFVKVLDSQRAWVKRTAPYFLTNNVTSAQLEVAYKHFFG